MRHTSILFANKSLSWRESEHSWLPHAQPHDFDLDPTLQTRDKSNQRLETETLQPIALEVRHSGLINLECVRGHQLVAFSHQCNQLIAQLLFEGRGGVAFIHQNEDVMISG